ncbi:putative oligomerization/nucleic acid binding protein [Fontibacillus phaseoli]|uniref:Putative oligomerization/nucleic acid binding protein n=1 Tax=Fontibacillus phaseoli TaxID=1416533 RepID=A0A369BA06_9BACL|nr:SHOCT domain-containing protein [Fontibacillus phaseoli]RCX17357.1 putative oligomerization/nucleic acid binding protein [Fontibacillus phaseoli]
MSKLLNTLLQSVNQQDIIDYAEGFNGLIAVTKNAVYLQRGKVLERKSLKTYTIKNIASIQSKKKTFLQNGYFQIIPNSGGSEVKRFTKGSDYLFDENTITIANNKDYENFTRLEQLIYKLQNEPSVPSTIAPTNQTVEDELSKLEKLAQLKDQGIISLEEFEAKKKEILFKV